MTTKRVAIGVCHGPRCRDDGGEVLLQELRAAGVDVQSTDCQSLCTYSPVVRLNGKCILKATMEDFNGQIQRS